MKASVIHPPRRAAAVATLIMTALLATSLTSPVPAQAAELDCSISVESKTVEAGATGLSASVSDAGEGATYAWELAGAKIEDGAETAKLSWAAPDAGTAKLAVSVTDAAGEQCSGDVEVSVTEPEKAEPTPTAETSAEPSTEPEVAAAAEATFTTTTTANASTVNAGDQVSFTILYQCSDGGSNCENAKIDWQAGANPAVGNRVWGDEASAHWTVVNGVCDNGTTSNEGDLLLGTVMAGQNGSCTVTLKVTPYFTPNGMTLTLNPTVTSSATNQSSSASVTVSASGVLNLAKRASVTQPAKGSPFDYEINLATVGNLTTDSYTVTDNLPLGAELQQVSVPVADGDDLTCTLATSPCTNGWLTITLTAATASAGPVVTLDYAAPDQWSSPVHHELTGPNLRFFDTAHITVVYPTTFTGTNVTNNAAVSGYMIGAAHTAANRLTATTTASHSFRDPYLNSRVSKVAQLEASPGAQTQWTIDSNTLAVTSNVASDITLTDSPLAAGPYQDYWRTSGLRVTEFSNNPSDMTLHLSFSDGTTNDVAVSASQFRTYSPSYQEAVLPIADLGGDTTTKYLTGVSATYPGIAAGDEVRLIIEGFFDKSIETVMAGGSVPVTNCVTMNTAQVGGTLTATGSTCRTLTVVPAKVRVAVVKAASIANTLPGQVFNYNLALMANGSKEVSPTVVDLLPAGVKYVRGADETPEAFKAATGLPDATFEVIDDYQGSGRQLLRWSWPGSFMAGEIGSSKSFTAFIVRVDDSVTAGTLVNDAYLLAGEDSMEANTMCIKQADSWDVDGDGDTTEQACYSSATVTVPQVAGGTVEKTVQGALDAAPVSTPYVGSTTPTGAFSYQLSYANTGTVPLKDVVFYDILPALGDTYVGASMGGNTRGSTWQVDLNGAVASDFSGTTTVEYSTSLNPCREEVYASAPGCVSDWTTSAPADLSTVRAVRILLSGTDLEPGTKVNLSIPVKPHDVAGPWQMAWNSVAQSATISDCTSNCQLLGAEPEMIGVASQPSAVQGNVWIDRDGDGVLGAWEEYQGGVNVTLTCVDAAGAETTYGPYPTDTEEFGAPGSYFFDYVLPGTCTSKVDTSTLPAGNWVQIFDADGSLDNQTTFNLPSGSYVWGYDFGYAALDSSVTITKTVNGKHSPTGTGPKVRVGKPVTWAYKVTNTGSVALTNVAVSDNDPAVNVDCGDGTNVVASLGAGESITCTAKGTAVAGQYTNVGAVTAMPDCSYCVREAQAVTATDTSHYLGVIVGGAEDDDDSLASTGWAGQAVIWVGLALLAAGGAMVWLRRRGTAPETK